MRITSAVFAAILLLATLPVSAAQTSDGDSGLGCGKERWPVKVLTDSDVGSVNFTPKASSVTVLRALPVPAGFDKYSVHRYPAEKQVVRVRAMLVGWKREADRDYHIVIAEPSNPAATMIVEPPDSACSTSPKAAEFSAVRAAFVKCFGQPGSWKKFPANEIVDLDGVVFFDIPHGQTGVSPNAIELHPLLKVKTVSGTCSASPG